MYILNVSKDGKHYFRIEKDNVYSDEIKKITHELITLYPISKGYRFDITEWNNTGKRIEL